MVNRITIYKSSTKRFYDGAMTNATIYVDDFALPFTSRDQLMKELPIALAQSKPSKLGMEVQEPKVAFTKPKTEGV